ncbi:MAG: 16S rRNA (guanine(527)-N(7))-methyltransferase RsmG [Thermoleophilia bacterium]|jgi:16S rRNA (guanine527-N7)-methyltransferase
MTWQTGLGADFHLDGAQVASFEKLLELLTAQSDRNLTAVTEPENIVAMHFRDSLGLIDFPETKSAGLAVDIGSGAGFPGLPLAIALPSMTVTMIEARRKKCEFIEKAIAALGLANASVLALRAEDAGRTEIRSLFDIAFARAVGSIAEVLEYCFPLLKIGGSALLQRGDRKPGDEEQAGRVAELLGGTLDRIESIKPYSSAKNLHIWVFSKTAMTPDRYPRRPGVARKRPLADF